MQITGYKLRESLRVWELRKTAAEQAFPASLLAFKGDENGKPKEILTEYDYCEAAIAHIETAQAYYNLQIKVKVGIKEITLCEAVKRVGGAGRAEKLWRVAVKGGKRDDNYSSYGNDRKNKDDEIAQRTISIKDAMEEATKAAKFAGELRSAIAEGNAKGIEIGFLNAEFIR